MEMYPEAHNTKSDLKRKRVAIVKYDMSHQGGSERVAANLANELASLYDVTLISMQMADENLSFPIKDKVEFVVLFNGNHRFSYLYSSLATVFREKINNMSFDVMICMGFETTIFPRLLKKRNRGRVIFSEQNIAENVFLKTKKVSFLRSFAVKHSDLTVVLSEDDFNTYKETYPKYAKQLYVNYNWIDDVLFENLPIKYNIHSKKIVSVGRISPVKNYEDLVEVAKRVFDVKKDWCWDIYGYEEPEYGRLVRNLIKDKGISDKVTLKGHHENIYDLYNEYSLFVHTAKTEGFGLVLIEAQSRGLPIIAFRGKGGMREIISNSENGFLVKTGDIDKMAEQILDLIDSVELRKDFSIHSRDGLVKFNKQKVLSQWVKFIESE